MQPLPGLGPDVRRILPAPLLLGQRRHLLGRRRALFPEGVDLAALAGVLVPLTLRRMNIDPALAGGVVLTTFTDVVGFLSFLGLGTLILLK